MEGQQEQNIEVEKTEEQPEAVEINTSESVQPKKKTISTRFGSLIILLVATIAGAGVWWYSFSYEEPVPMDVGQVVRELQARRVVETEVLSDYEIRDNGVYYKDELIEGANPETFELLTANISKDDKSLYLFGLVDEIPNLDIKDVRVTDSEQCIASKESVYCYTGISYYERDPRTLEPYGDEIFYYAFLKVNHADPWTFVDVGMGCFKDKNNVYCRGDKQIHFPHKGGEFFRMFNVADVNSFVHIENNFFEHYYFKDSKNVYRADMWNLNIVEGADVDTVDVVSSVFAKDSKNIYKFGKKVEGADPANCSADNLEGCEGFVYNKTQLKNAILNFSCAGGLPEWGELEDVMYSSSTVDLNNDGIDEVFISVKSCNYKNKEEFMITGSENILSLVLQVQNDTWKEVCRFYEGGGKGTGTLDSTTGGYRDIRVDYRIGFEDYETDIYKWNETKLEYEFVE